MRRALLPICLIVAAAGCRPGPTLDLGDDGERMDAGQGAMAADANSRLPDTGAAGKPEEGYDASMAARDGEAACDEARCTACVVDADCHDAAAPFCDGEHGCVACLADEHCTDPNAPLCGEESRCVECAEDSHCPDGSSCDTDSGRCLVRR